MHFGIIADPNQNEHRVILAPFGVEEIVANGHKVTVESGAGERTQFSDKDYANSGAEIVYSKEEAWMRPDMLLRFRPPGKDGLHLLRKGQIFGSYVELPFLPSDLREAYASHELTFLAFEEMRDAKGRWPLLAPLSIISGRMLPQIAARYLESFEGGRGKLIAGAPGVAPCNVAIIGAGILGQTAMKMFQKMGARVTILDINPSVLDYIELSSEEYVATLTASPGNIMRVCRGSDVIILSVHCPNRVCPRIITREHLKLMQPRTLLIDASITQGGCAETSRPTDVFDPTYVVDDVVHYCNTRITALVARTASRAVSSAVVSYLLHFAEHSIEDVIQHAEFDSGLVVLDGKMRRKYEDS